ncbi:MAG: bifunctional phosphopantothenoylcysteine decarboxylase/phosphopantothenate--cysteine ligase CoaBC [Bacteroidales bacterium]|nr:bifunctional phosphopantothenoylcysteine decarboxylase/phosphopantothenate--cysteine ligase CoaBC [Bacteroidales bacterium]
MLKGKKIVVGITGSIAAYKIPFLVRILIKEGVDVRVIMTPVAKDFVTPLTLATLSQHPVIVDPFKANDGEWNNHVELGQWADAMIFAPVTANTLGKMAHGIADNFVVTAYLSAKCPVFIAPAMDLDMFAHPSTKNNIDILRSFGNVIIEPQVGELASGLSGPGRLEEPESILQIIKTYFSQKLDLNKKKVLITAGPTHEKIDPVRYLGNYSTGKMGFSLAEEAARRGATVTLIAGPSSLVIEHPGVNRINVESAEEMYQACMKEAPQSEIVIMAAAVADYTIVQKSKIKLKKSTSPLKLELSPTPDILLEIGKQKKKNQILVGFALETEHEVDNAKKKLIAKNLDYIVLNSLNDKGAGFGVETNKVSIIDRSGTAFHGVLQNKALVAAEIIDFIIKKRTFQP